MLIRAKYHWLPLSLAFLDFFAAAIVGTINPDHFMVMFYLCSAGVLLLVWFGTYTTLRNGVLKRRLLFFTHRTIPVAEIDSVRPHKKNGKWSYGTVVDIYPRTGKKLTLQPNHPQPFLALLREQSPQASFQI
jgi:predicted membrane metal-binding protein